MLNIINNSLDTREIRTVVKDTHRKEFDQEFLKKWMELQQAFMNHLERQTVPKFPAMNAVEENGKLPQFPVEMKNLDNFDDFPLKIKDDKDKDKSVFEEDKIQGVDETTTARSSETTEVDDKTQRGKRDIHCCFKLNDGHNSGERNDREHLKQIDLKIENKKMKGSPLKETCIEMILTKDKMNKKEDKVKLVNASITTNRYDDEMEPFQIGLKNYTNDKAKISKIQGIHDFNKLKKSTKVNKGQEKWDKHIKKLYEIINEEKKKEERNKTTYSSLHQLLGDDDLKKLWLQPIPTETELVKAVKDEHQQLTMKKSNRNVTNENALQQLFKDKTSRKMLANHILSKFYNLNLNKDSIDPLNKDLKIKYQNCVNKFRDDLIKMRDISRNLNSSYDNGKSFFTEGIKVNIPIISRYDSKIIKDNMLRNPEIFLHKVYKTNPLIPNEQVKDKILKKCENLKSNISQILVLMSELQSGENANTGSINSSLQNSGFNKLLNNLRKFNNNPNFNMKYISGKDVTMLSKLRMGSMNPKSFNSNNEIDEKMNLKETAFNQGKKESNLSALDEKTNTTVQVDNLNNNLTDLIDIKLTLPTLEMTEDGTSKDMNLTSKVVNFEKGKNFPELTAKVTGNIHRNVAITQNGKTFNYAMLKVNDLLGKNISFTDNDVSTTSAEKIQSINYKNPEISKVEESGSATVEPNEHKTEKINNTLEYVNEVTSEKAADMFQEKIGHSPHESILESISGKSIIKLVQKETPGFDKYFLSSTVSPVDIKEDSEIRKVNTGKEPFIIKLAQLAINNTGIHLKKNKDKIKKYKTVDNSTTNGIFKMSKLTKIANQMQDVPHKITMPIIMDILNSLMYNDDDTEDEEEPGVVRVKRESCLTKDVNLYPSDDSIGIDMKTKKGKRKKNKKNKGLVQKFTKGHMRNMTEEKTIKSLKRNKNEHKKKKIKPIYMPNVRGYSGIQFVPPFLFGDNIITINVTPCDDYYIKKNDKNMINIRKNESTMVTEAKYFVMNNLKGETTERTKTRLETQLRIPLKIFRGKEKATTIAVTPESRTRIFESESETKRPQQRTTESKKIKIFRDKEVTKAPDVKMKNSNLDLPSEKQILNLINTTNNRLFESVKPPVERKFESTTKRVEQTKKMLTPEPMDFTFTITLKSPKVQNLKTPIDNVSYFINASRSTTRKGFWFKMKDNDTDLDYDSEYEVTESNWRTSNWMSEEERKKFKIPELITQLPVTKVELKEYVVTPLAAALHNKSWNIDFKELLTLPSKPKEPDKIQIENNYRTTPKSSQQTEDFKDSDYNIIYQDFKEFKNGETLESLKANISKDNLERERFEQTSETPMTTEQFEDYIFNLEQQTDNEPEEMTKEPEAVQNDITIDQEREMSNDTMTRMETTEENESEDDSTEMQYEDELESIMESLGESPKLVSLYRLPLVNTEPITEVQTQTEPEENFNNLVLDYGIPELETNQSNQEITQNYPTYQYNEVYTEIIQVKPITEPPNQQSEEKKNGEDYSMSFSEWLKANQNYMIPNAVSEDQSYSMATTNPTSTDQFEERYNNEEDDEDEDNDNEEERREEERKEEERKEEERREGERREEERRDEERREEERRDEERREEERREEEIATTMRLVDFYQNPPITESSSDENDDDEEEDDATEFQELLFWQNLTEKQDYQTNQKPSTEPIDIQNLETKQNKTIEPIKENDNKTLKSEMEQLRQLIDKDSLSETVDSSTNFADTSTIYNYQQESTSDNIKSNYNYSYIGNNLNQDSGETVQNVMVEKMRNYTDNVTNAKVDNPLQKTDERMFGIHNMGVNEPSSPNQNATYLEQIDKSFLGNLTTVLPNIVGEMDNDIDDSPSDEDEEEEDLEIGSEDPEILKLDDIPDTIDATNALEMMGLLDKNSAINQNINLHRANESKLKISDIINLNKSPDMTNQVELPPIHMTNQVELSPIQPTNQSKIDQASFKDVNFNNNTYIQPEKGNKVNYWSAKKAAKFLRRNPIGPVKKEKIDPNLENDSTSEVILLDNASNDPADWVLHEDALWNMDPWESFKNLNNNKLSKETIQKDKLLKDILMSKIEIEEPKIGQVKEGMINYPNPDEDFQHHTNLFVKLDREPFQTKDHYLFDQISKKYIKASQPRHKYKKNRWNDSTIVLLRPNLSTLKDKYSEENDVLSLSKNMQEIKNPRPNAKAMQENSNVYWRRILDRRLNEIRSSKKSKTQNKNKKHRNKNIKKKIKLKQKTRTNATNNNQQQTTIQTTTVSSTDKISILHTSNTSDINSQENTTVLHSQNNNTVVHSHDNTTVVHAYDNNNVVQSQNNTNIVHSQDNNTVVHLPDNNTFVNSPDNLNQTQTSVIDYIVLTTVSSHVATSSQSGKDDIEIYQMTTPSSNNKQFSTKQPCKQFHLKSIIKNGNLENLMWDREDRWERLNNNLNKVEKLYDRNMMRKINKNFRKNFPSVDAKLYDKAKGVIKSSRKSNQKSLNFYKQRLNRKMSLLKSLQNKNSEAKITPEEERKIKKILDGIVSRYKGRTNDTIDENYMRYKSSKYNIGTKRNFTRMKNHRKFPRIMKMDKNRCKCRSKGRYLYNLTDVTPQHKLLSSGRNKKIPLSTYNRMKDRVVGWRPKKINKHLLLTNYNSQINDQLYRDKKDYVVGWPHIRTIPYNNSTGYLSIINTHLKKLPNCSETNHGITKTVSEFNPNCSLYSQKRGKPASKVNDIGSNCRPIQGILSLVYPDDLMNSSKAGDNNGRIAMGSGLAGYSGVGLPFNNYHINSNQFEELLKSLDGIYGNSTESSENKYKDLAMIVKENQKIVERNRSRDSLDEVKAKLKAINWLLNFKNAKINKLGHFKEDVLQSTSCSKQDGNFIDQNTCKDREDVENMKKFITKYKTLLKMFEEQCGKIDARENMNQFIRNFKEPKDGTVLVQKPIALWKKYRSRDKTLPRMEEQNKNLLLDNNKKKTHRICYMYGQNKQTKDLDNSADDSPENEDIDVIKTLQEDDDDNLETCNDIEFESYDDHQMDKIKENDLVINNMSLIQQVNGTNSQPASLLGKYKTLDNYKGYQNGQNPKLKSYRENDNYKGNSTINKMFKSRINPLSCIGELNYDRPKGNWENWTIDQNNPNPKNQLHSEEMLQPNITEEDKEEVAVHGNDNNILMLPIKFNTSDFIKLLNYKELNDSDSIYQEDDLNSSSNRKTKMWNVSSRNGYVFDIDRGGPNGIKNRYYITFDSLFPNTVKVKNISTIPMTNFSNFVNMVGPGLNAIGINNFASPWDKNQSIIDNRYVKGNLKPEIRSIEKVCLWLRKPLSYNLTHQVPKVAISLGEVWPPMSEGQGPRNMKHYLVQVDPLLTPSKFPNQHIDYPSQISKVVWKAILHGFKTPKKTWQLSNQLG